MKKKTISLMLAFLMCFTFAACTGSKNETYEFYDDFSSENTKPIEIETDGAEDATLESMNAVFQTQYGMSKLESQKLLFNGETIIFEAYFSDDVPYSEIKSAMDYGIIYMFNGRYDNISPTDYGGWRIGVSPKAVLSNIYVGDTLTAQQYFDGESDLRYENTQHELKCREYSSEALDKIKPEIEKITKGKLKSIRSLTRDGLILQIKGSGQIAPEKLEEVKSAVEAMSSEFTRVIIELYSGDSLYYDAYFLDGQWQTGKWA